MTEQEQRIAIAEACGWQRNPKDELGVIAWRKGEFDAVPASMLPNYLSDLNAMHEAEKILTPEQEDRYHCALVNLNGGGKGFRPAISSTAAQRAEAFLRTIGKWKD